jgi:regulator of cell morphogenesis and NO signaling
MEQLISKTLSEIVNEQFQTASVFEKYHLDYCCRGRRSLREACEEENVPVNEIVEELTKVYLPKPGTLDFNSIKLYELAEYIVHTHHSYVKKEMTHITSFLQKVSSKHGNRHPELFKISKMFNDLAMEMTDHMEKEELIVFPRIKQLEKNGLNQLSFDAQMYEYLKLPIINMGIEHEDAGNIMNGIRLLTDNYTPPADACTTYKLLYACLHAFEIDLHQHVHLENSILFPKALMLEKEIQMSAHN